MMILCSTSFIRFVYYFCVHRVYREILFTDFPVYHAIRLSFPIEYQSYRFVRKSYPIVSTAAVAQWVRAFTPQPEGWVLESMTRHT